jgi:hypothetical protein
MLVGIPAYLLRCMQSVLNTVARSIVDFNARHISVYHLPTSLALKIQACEIQVGNFDVLLPSRHSSPFSQLLTFRIVAVDYHALTTLKVEKSVTSRPTFVDLASTRPQGKAKNTIYYFSEVIYYSLLPDESNILVLHITQEVTSQ